MKVEIIILGLLMKENLCGYVIKKMTEDLLKDFADLKLGSVYYALNKADQKGWIKKVGNEKEKGSLEKYTYQILPAGQEEFKKLLKEYLQKTRIHFNTDMLLIHLNQQMKQEEETFLEDRKAFIKKKMDHVKEASHNNITKINYKHMLTYLEHHLKAEMTWLKTLNTK